MNKKSISVIMAVYNTPVEYLKQSIDSILNQTFKDFELIIVNDGSTNSEIDKTIKNYKDKRIKYFVIKNSGASEARNYGIKKANGKYIAILDSDDIALPNRLEKEFNFLEKNVDISVVGGNMEIFNEKGITEYTNVRLNPKILDFFKENSLAHSTVMWRKKDFDKYNLKYDPEYPIAQDYELWLQAIKHLKISNIPDVLCKYRLLESSLSHAKYELLCKDVEKSHKSLLDYLTSDEQIKQALIKITTAETKKDKVGFLFPKWAGRIICCFMVKRKNRHNFRDKYVKD